MSFITFKQETCKKFTNTYGENAFLGHLASRATLMALSVILVDFFFVVVLRRFSQIKLDA